MPVLERLLRIIAPHYCLGCGQEGAVLCRWCLPEACPPLPAQCYRCHRLSSDSRTCSACRPRTRLGSVWMRTEYDGVAKQLVHALKFTHNQAVAVTAAELLQESLPYLPDDTIIVHVPTSTSHVRQRGYDQAKLLARNLADRLDRRHLTLLARQGQQRQVGSKRQERLTQLSGAFRPLNTSVIKGSQILLVDDVLTTGATLEAAARTLKAAGAKQIRAAVFARSLLH